MAAIVVRLGIVGLAGPLGVSAGLSGNSVLLAAGLSPLDEGVVVLARGAASGTPFATKDVRQRRAMS